ncbi:hypothetical protein DVH26_07715 [Paenibacillus sp. H1-7]|uniref:hypothetical protein n=1 Tax=Paenibacillus sp. H1-7 TaxID=2282849 RepID=UPI001EF816DF|nr:hypothetical protein [Paenibacillus sp. H1-7]ULL14345.1 hypothetical protein DVH26_07715 [Paenibacillus sp. H1-7]
MNETLEQEKERLQKRLELLNVNSRGRDRIVERIKAINDELGINHKPPPDEREGAKERFSSTNNTIGRPTVNAS